jgi:hypothetical protein
LGVFFHPWCAPQVKLPKKAEEELVDFLAQLIVADFKERSERWATVSRLGYGEDSPPTCQAHVASVYGHRVFTMTRADWRLLKAHEGKLVEIALERTPAGSAGEASAAIASLAADCPVEAQRIEVWRHHALDPPPPLNVQEYLVLESLARRVNVPAFAERASIEDSPRLRKHLRDHVFLVKKQTDKGR